KILGSRSADFTPARERRDQGDVAPLAGGSRSPEPGAGLESGARPAAEGSRAGMSDRALPDDPAQWPNDPYELLGVAPEVSPPDLKRAYAQLIHRFKPEQHPEQFRLIRQAYEVVLRCAEMGIVFRVRPADESEPPAGELLSRPTPIVLDDADRLCEQALNGEEAAAYAGLRALSERQPQRQDLLLRLYWLRTVFPDVDPERSAADWLIAAVRESGLSGPAMELLRLELLDHPIPTLAATT